MREETLDKLLKHESNLVTKHIPFVLKEYNQKRAKLPRKLQKILDEATSQRYIVLHDKSSKNADLLENACIRWCKSHTTPMVFIGPKKGKGKTHIRFLLEHAIPSSAQSIYTPDFCDPQSQDDEAFSLMMLLANDYMWGSNYIHLQSVFIENAEEVARQMIAMYDRMYQKNLEELKQQYPQLEVPSAAS